MVDQVEDNNRVTLLEYELGLERSQFTYTAQHFLLSK
jgi:hypothetical protein